MQWKICIAQSRLSVCGLLCFAACIASIGLTELPGIFDELEHSYAAHLQEIGRFLSESVYTHSA